MATPPGTPGEIPVVRLVGPPGSGKSLMITSLTEAFRARDIRTAVVVHRDRLTDTTPDTGRITVVMFSSGSRVTIERRLRLDEVAGIVRSIDPTVQLILAEGFEGDGVPTVELRPPGTGAYGVATGDLLAVVDSAEASTAFARSGPGETGGLADLIERVVLGRGEPAEDRGLSGRLGRLFRRGRGGDAG